MERTIPKLHRVRCPKCLRVLEEPPGITLYTCGGCGATLQANVQSSSGETLSLTSASGSSKNISNSASKDNQNDKFEKQTPSSSDQLGDQDQDHLKVSGSSGERNVEEFSGIGIKAHVSDSSGESLEEKGKSPVYEKSGIKGIALENDHQTEQFIPKKVKNNLNEESKLSSDQEIPVAKNCLKSSDKLKESPEHDTSSEDNKINRKIRKDDSFSLRSSSHTYEGSVSSIDEEEGKHLPQKYLVLSRRTFGRRTSSVYTGKVTSRKGVQSREREFSFVSEDFQSALNWMESENDAPSISKSKKDAKHSLKFKYSEKDDKVKIMRKVDELKSELLEFFQRTTDAKADARLSLTAHFEGKVPPRQYRSSLHVPLSKQSNAFCLNPHHGDICCHNKVSRHNACCHLPEGTTSHLLHMKRSSSLNQEPQNLQCSDKKRQTVKRHCRPVSGGAPFVICYRCYNLLQLPADFLVSTKKVHKLRCGSCHEVLKYFFRPRIRSMPWTPAEARHPPSEEESNKALHNEIGVPVSKDLAGGDPVSYSEDYDFSFGKSYSYEAEPSRCLPRNDNIVEEEQSGKEVRGSQLHKLMGYSSARYLLFETLSPVEGHRLGQDR